MDVLKGGYELSRGLLKRQWSRNRGGRRKQDALLYSESFTESELTALCNYKGKGCDRSITYKYLMSKVYDQAVQLLPMWLAPNAVTLIGLCFVLVPHIVMSFYAPTLSEEAPGWVYLLNFIGLFMYMLLDNLDGRQARRTGAASPLGHMFDHTCDAINVAITGLTVACTLRLGNNVYTLLLIWFFGMSVFFTATIEEFYTGSLILREINGANEGLLTMQGFYLFSAIFGTELWMTPIQITSSWVLPLGKCVIFLVVPVSMPTIAANYHAILKESKKSNERLFYESLYGSIPFAICTVAMFGWAMSSSVLKNYPFLFIWACELAFLHIVSYVIVSHLCGRHSLPSFSFMVFPLILGMANAVIAKLGAESVLELPLLFGVVIISAVVNAIQAYRIARQICEHLNIRVFSISKLHE